ncbi:MAG TPA: hypothetical protein VN192_01610 [Flavobacterium sp.]|nr:hypothetical protein [Flavobacterium sp.]
MNSTTIVLLLVSFIIAAGISFYQYLYKNTNKSTIHILLTCLRFISVFSILILLINPIISNKTYEIVKTPLPIIIDNSSSIVDLNANTSALDFFDKISKNKDLQDKFDVQLYRFDNEFQTINKPEDINFKGTQTNFEEVAENLKNIYRNSTFPTVLITDGNQSIGNDYVYSFEPNNKVFPVVVGDTTAYLDLKVVQLNVNKYAFYKNKFPVEVFLQYSGNKSITAQFKIYQGNSVLAQQSISFSPTKKSEVISVLLPADKTGLQIFKANISSKENEKNTFNNTKNFAVEVIDQKTNIGLVSSISHPDLGVLKRSIESNAQRKVRLLKPKDIKSLQDFNVLILYQPASEFKSVFEKNELAGINTFIITGTNTDFNFLNQIQKSYVFKMSNQKENYIAKFDPQFNLFAIDDLGFEQFPPLENNFGSFTSTGNVSVLLSSKIRNIDTNMPLLAFTENQGKRSAFLFGEHLWKWRLKYHKDYKSFEKFDVFTDKIIQYLASNNTKKSLIVNHENFYNSGDAIEIIAQFFNKNYEFDEKARLMISLTNKTSKNVRKYDFLKTNNAFKVNLDGLESGQYNFSVKELNSNTNYSGYFEILDFDIEKQFVNPDINKLNQLASQTQGKLYFPTQSDSLIKFLLKNQDYKTIQKAIVQKVPLIDWIWLLIIIAISLSAEWFIRKYNGLM